MPQNRCECPACEFVFSVNEEESADPIACPDCGTAIPAHTARAYGTASPRVAPRSHVPLPTPQRVAARRKTPPPLRVAQSKRGETASDAEHGIKIARRTGHPSESHAAIAATSGSIAAQPLSEAETRWKSAGSPAPASAVARRKSGRRMLALLSTLAIAFAALGAAGYFLFINDGGIFAKASEDDLATNSGEANTDTSSEDDATSTEPEEDLALMSEEELNSVWEEIAPYVVQIESQTSAGPVTGCGILIDTRGWIATSLHLVAGASTVSVQFADGTNDSGTTKPREIRSRGVIAYDVHHDLAIISISDEELSVDDDIVLSIDRFPADDAALAACGAPATGRWIEACSMLANETVEYDFFPLEPGAPIPVSDSESETDLMKLRLNADVRYDGGPLLRADGAVAGILIGQQSDWPQVHAVSVKHLRRLRDFAEDQPSSFASTELVQLARSREGDPGVEMMNDEVAASRAEPGTVASRDTIAELHRQCSTFEWNPRNENDYRVLTELAQYLTAAEDIAADEAADEGTRLLLDEPAQAVRKELSATGWPSEDAIARINGFATNAIDSNAKGVYCYAKVELPPGLSPEMDGSGTVTLSLLGTDKQIIMPVSESHEFLQSGTEWLIVGTRTNTRAVVVEDETTGLRTEVPLVYAIYLIERPEQIARTGNRTTRNL